jgi:hypothetical protein
MNTTKPWIHQTVNSASLGKEFQKGLDFLD